MWRVEGQGIKHNTWKVEFIDDCAYMHTCMHEARVCVRA